MKDERLTISVVAITIALLGLVAIQVTWIQSTLALRYAQLEQSIDDALLAVSERLERVEKWEGIRSTESGKRILERSGASGQEAPLRTLDSMVDRSLMEEALSDPEREALITDMVRGILSQEHMGDIVERVDPKLLDSLLQEELITRGVEKEHIHGIFSDEGELVWEGAPRSGNVAELANSVHRVRLFRNDLAGPGYYLHVIVPGEQRAVWLGIGPLLLLSFLFLLVVVLAFLHTLRTIYRQKRISAIKNDLVNNLTHELKTPISTIALACEALNDPSLPHGPEQVRSFVGMIRDENKRLGVLVENVLQSAVLDSGGLRLKLVDLDVHRMLRDVARNTEMQLRGRNGTIELDLKAEVYHVKADRIHFTNVFHNLLDNAVKYTEKRPEVRVSTTSDNTGLTIHISDNGIGIPRSEQKKIFDRLYRVSTGNVHNVKGFGLGLSYVQNVVTQHGGTIRVESEPGVGSTFHITIPYEHDTTE